MSKRVLITGATGFVGQRLCIRLFEKGYDLVVLSRDPEKAKLNIPVPVEAYTWDQIEEVKEIHSVVNLAGENIAIRWSEKNKKKILDSRVESTRKIVDWIKMVDKKPESLVQASAIGYYGDTGDQVVEETSSRGEGFLADVTDAWEKEASHVSSHTRVAVLRIGIVLGHEGGILEKLRPLFLQGLGGKISSGKAWMSVIHLEDLVSVMIHAIENASYEGVINAVSPQPIQNEEFTKLLKKKSGSMNFFTVPKTALKVMMGEMAEIATQSQRVLPKKLEDLDFYFLYPNCEIAFERLFPVQPGEGYLEFIQWIPKSRSEVFEFFSDEKNLEKITPDSLQFKVLDMSTPAIEKGTLINYQLKVHGIPVKWQTKIKQWNPRDQFIDEQLKGPYTKWEHLHLFSDLRGGTLMRDEVVFKLPLSWLGRFSGIHFVLKDVQKIFEYRKKIITKIFS